MREPGTIPASLLLFLTVTEGAAVMVAELVGARVLAPLYGSTLPVWGAVIGMSLLALAAGYRLGGIISYRAGPGRHLDWLAGLLLAAALLLIVMPRLAAWLLPRLEAFPPLWAITGQVGIYLVPPLLLLGAAPPLVVALLAARPAAAGGATGTVFGVSTLGGILGTLAAGFWLMPVWGLGRTAAAAGLLLGLVPLVLLLGRRRWSAALVPVAAAFAWPAMGPLPADGGVDVLHASEGLLGQLRVIDVEVPQPPGLAPRVDRILFVNRMAQTWVRRDSGEAVWGYVGRLRSLASLQPSGSAALLLGLGGGIVARDLQGLGFTVDSVELDGRIVEVARRHFGFEPNGEVIIDDGRHYLRTTPKRYDLVVLDVYQAEIPPGHLLTVEAFQELHRVLAPGGFFVINYPGFLTGSIGLGGRSILRTLQAAGYFVHLLPTAPREDSGNLLYIAAPEPVDFGRPRLPLRRPDGSVLPLPALFRDPETVPLDDALVLVDNRPVLERLSLEAGAAWRQGYYRHFTRPLLERGVPLFE